MKANRPAFASLALVFAVALIGPPTLAGQETEWAVGSWEGTLAAGPQTLQLIYHVVPADGGGLTGTMDVPAQGATGIPLTTVTVEGQSLTMTFPVPGGGSYEGTLGDSGTLSGTFTQGPASFPLELIRVNESKER